MAKTHAQIQKAALKVKAKAADEKLTHACFGQPCCPKCGGMHPPGKCNGGVMRYDDGGEVTEPSTMGYTNGGYMHKTKRYDQTGSPGMGCMADGGPVDIAGLKGKRQKAIDDAVEGAVKPVNTPAQPSTPAAPESPKDPLTAQLEAREAARKAAPAPAPKKGVFGIGVLGLVNGGSVAAPKFRGRVNATPGFVAALADGGELDGLVGDDARRARIRNAGLMAQTPVQNTVSSFSPTIMPDEPFRFGHGGMIRGPGTGTSDSILAQGPRGQPIRVSNGEYVLPADTVAAIGKDTLDNIRAKTHTPIGEAQMNGMADGGFDARLARSGDPSTGSATIMTPANTRGARAPLFGSMLVNGGQIPGYADGLPPDPVKVYGGNANIPTDGTMSREAQAYQASRAAPAPTPTAQPAAPNVSTVAPAAEEAAAATSKNLFGRAASTIGNAASKVYNAAKGAASFGTIGDVAGGAARLATKVGYVPGAAILGAARTLDTPQDEQDAFERSVTMPGAPASTAPGRSVGANILRTASNVGNTITGGLAGELGERIANAVPEVQDALAKGTPVLSAAAKGFGAPVIPHIQNPGVKTLNPEQGASSQVPSAGPAPAQEVAPGIVRQGNSYFGVGAHGPLDTSTGSPADIAAQSRLADIRDELAARAQHVGPISVLTHTPDERGQYRGGGGNRSWSAQGAAPSTGGAFGAPAFYESPEAAQTRASIADLTSQLSNARPGQEGTRFMQRKLAGLEAAYNSQREQDSARNVFNQATFGRAQELAMHRMSLRNQAVGYDVQRQGNELNFAKGMAEVNNTLHQNMFNQSQARLGNAKDRLVNLAKADGGDPELYQVAAATRLFPGDNGKPTLYQDLSDEARARADGVIQLQASKMKARKDAGLPYSLSDRDVNEDPGIAGWVKSFSGAPWNTVKFGATQTGSWRTARPKIYASHEMSEADAQQQGKK